MKKQIAMAIAVAGISASATVAFAGLGAATGINGSKHDLNSLVPTYTGDTLGRTCVFCHTPHNAIKGGGDGETPLWNHADTTVQLQPYAWVSPANKTIPMNTDPLIGPTRLCMACHDGVTAVDAHGSANGNIDNGGTWTLGTTHVMTSSYTDALGHPTLRYINDLQVTHPIGFKYSDAYAARPGELVPSSFGYIVSAPYGTAAATFDTHSRFDSTGTAPGTTFTLSTKKIQDTLYGNTNTTGTESNGYMTCATCHDVHNTVNAVPDAGHDYNYFLYAKEEGSAICLSCHIK